MVPLAKYGSLLLILFGKNSQLWAKRGKIPNLRATGHVPKKVKKGRGISAEYVNNLPIGLLGLLDC